MGSPTQIHDMPAELPMAAHGDRRRKRVAPPFKSDSGGVAYSALLIAPHAGRRREPQERSCNGAKTVTPSPPRAERCAGSSPPRHAQAQGQTSRKAEQMKVATNRPEHLRWYRRPQERADERIRANSSASSCRRGFKIELFAMSPTRATCGGAEHQHALASARARQPSGQ